MGYRIRVFGRLFAPPLYVQMILTSLSNLPETMRLFLIGLVLILSGIALRRVFLTFETASTGPGQNIESKEQPLK